MANPDSQAQKEQVLSILHDLGLLEAEGGASKIPLLEAWNKWDLLTAEEAAHLIEQKGMLSEPVVPVSALTGMGCDDLLDAISKLLTQKARLHTFVLPLSEGQRIAWLHANGEVLNEEDGGSDERGPLTRIEVRLDPRELGRFSRL
jgi:GTP-binding protein HflX